MRNLTSPARGFVLVVLVLFLAFSAGAQFQRQYGTALDESFSEVIQSGANYFVLGMGETTDGQPGRATITRLDATGTLQWTLGLNIASQWTDAVLTPTGSLLVIGHSLPDDNTSRSIMGLVTAAGTFSWVRAYDLPQRDAFLRVVRNPAPQNPDFPYYVLGTQTNAMTANTDMVLLNLNESGSFNWKKIYNGPVFFTGSKLPRDLEVLPGGDLLIAVNLDDQGLIMRTDNAGLPFAGVTPDFPIVFEDIAPGGGGSVYAVGAGLQNAVPYMMKFDTDLVDLWDVTLEGMDEVRQVWLSAATGSLYVQGRKVREACARFSENNDGPELTWIKNLYNNEIANTNATISPLAAGQIAFADGRTPASGGFGQLCAFLSVSDPDLNTACLTVENDGVVVLPAGTTFNGPLLPDAEFYDVLAGTNLNGSLRTWQQADVCNSLPCTASFNVNFVDNCGHVQIISTSSGQLPLSYQWCSGESTADLDLQLPCGSYTYCVSVTCADGSVSTASQSINVSENIPPVAVCVPGFGITLDPDCTTTLTPVMIDGGSTDNCRIQAMDISPKILTGCGDFPVTLTVTDWCGNVGTCTTSVQTIETVPPNIMCPPDLQVSCDNNLAPNLTGQATATDNCPPAPVITYSDQLVGVLPCNGVVQRSWTATDSCGNQASCVQNIVVLDNVPPMIACPQDLTVGTDPGQCYYTGAIPVPTATDNCNPNPAVTCYLVTDTGLIPITSQTKFPKGDNTICCIADDGCVKVDSLLCGVPCGANRVERPVIGDTPAGGNSTDLLTTLDVQPGIAANELVREGLVGGDCFDVDNIAAQGQPSQLGTFINGNTNIGFASGVILATGPAILAVGPNDSDAKGIPMGGANTPDPDLATLTTGAQFDVASLEFDFIPTANIVSLRYVFASEAYCELAGSALHDVFGIFISGPGIPGGKQNIALVPTTTTPVGISTVNHLSFSGFYVNNQPAASANLCGQSPAAGPVVNEVQYDGFTRIFTAVANVTPGQTYHLKIAIADVGDGLNDSAVFLAGGSFDAGGGASATWAVNGDPDLHTVYEDCGTVELIFDRLGPATVPLPVNFTVGGTATPGVDYAVIPTSIVIPAGQDKFALPVTILNEGVLESDETIIITLSDPCSAVTPQKTLTIRDYLLTQAKCTFILSVEDQEPPMITCPPSVTVYAGLDSMGTCSAVLSDLAPNLSDNCPMLMADYAISGATTAAGTNFLNNTTFAEGTSTVTYTVTDMGGNTDTCTFTVTVICFDKQAENCCLAWAGQFGGLLPDGGDVVTADAAGNVFIAGSFEGMVDFDPGPGVYNLTAQSARDAFLVKLSPTGNFLWALQIKGSGFDYINDITLDPSGNLYITGTFQGVADFDPGVNAYNLTSQGAADIFVLKLDPSGGFFWAFGIGSISLDVSQAIALGAGGDLILTGQFFGPLDLDPGPGVAGMVPVGSSDLFIANFSPSGAFNWARQIGGPSLEAAADLTTDLSGNILVTGSFTGTVDFDPGPGVFNLSPGLVGSNDIFITKFDGSGNFLWANTFPRTSGAGTNHVNSIAVDVLGNVFTTGLLSGATDFDPGPGTTVLTPVSPSAADIFVSKLSATGAYSWAKRMGGSTGEGGESLATDLQGNVYISGGFSGTFDFDPGPGVSVLSSPGGASTFVQKLTNAGDFIWAKPFGGLTSQSSGLDLFVAPDESVYCSGTFSGSGDFDPGVNTYNLTSAGQSDAYFFKLDLCSKLDTCYCGVFSDLFIRGSQGAMSRPVLCGGPPLNIGCPTPGIGFTLTGSFLCAGNSCPSEADMDWSLYGPNGSAVAVDSTSADPWFGINLPSSAFSQSGEYTLVLTGHCGSDGCPCIIKFIVDEGCMETCPCDLADLMSDVNQGFATAFSANSCGVCFTPLALSDCDEVEWRVDNPQGPVIGMSAGNQTFCYTFANGGTYTVYMTVIRKRADGSLCESSVKAQTVTVTCFARTVCDASLLPNPDFEEGAVAGSLGMEGMISGWTRVWGDPHVQVSDGKKKVRLAGNLTGADVLSTQEPVCLQKTTGTISLRFGIKEKGQRGRLVIGFFTGDTYTFGECNSESCFQIAEIELPPADTSEELDLVIPYDLSGWMPVELCGNGSGVMIRPAIFVINDLGDEQGVDTRTVIDLDYCCLDGMLVGLNPVQQRQPMRLYPNPNSGTFTLELPEGAASDMTIRVVGLTGQVLLEQQAETGRIQQTVETRDLPAGLYFVQLTAAARMLGVAKFVKQ